MTQNSIIKISEAANMALHTMVLLAKKPHQSMTTQEVADILKASQAHLAKVLQRLLKADLVKSERGPKGGYLLAKPAKDITLLQVYEAIDGRIKPNTCLLGSPVCGGKECIMGGMLKSVSEQVIN